MYQRRKNLTGIQLKIESKPISNQREHMIHKEILALFREEFNFTIDWLSYSGSYGAYDPINETWNGMMNELIENETDLAPYKPSKTIIKNNLRDLRYYSHLFSQHCFNNKKQCTSRKKTKNAQPRLEPAPFERPIVV